VPGDGSLCRPIAKAQGHHVLIFCSDDRRIPSIIIWVLSYDEMADIDGISVLRQAWCCFRLSEFFQPLEVDFLDRRHEPIPLALTGQRRCRLPRC
jgi:hypothetical protein